jgi:hypothetical protein
VEARVPGVTHVDFTSDFLNPQTQADPPHVEEETVASRAGILTEEEERELDELMD